MTQDKTIVLHTYNDMLEAQIACDKLKENGIESFLADENVMGLDPVGGAELKIFEKDKEAAERIINNQ
jgi:Putative prokaryotic signal transducing protein